MLRSIAFVTIATFILGSLTHAQNKADRKDEKRENERVQDAKTDLQKAQRELGAAVKAFRLQKLKVRSAEGSLYSTQLAYSRAREEAEERLADSSGLPEAIRKMRSLRDEIAMVTKPILEELHKTQKWIVVSKKANDSRAILEELLADESRTDDELQPKVVELEKLIAAPKTMETAAVDADPKLKQLKLDYDAALDSIADLRRKIDASKIDADPEIKASKGLVESMERELNQERKSLDALNAKVAKYQGNVGDASKRLQQAQAADQKDSNKKKKN